MEFLHFHVPFNYLAMNNMQYIVIYHRPTRCSFTLQLWGRMKILKLTERQIFYLFKLLNFSWVRKHDEYETARGMTAVQLPTGEVKGFLTLTKVHCKQFWNDSSFTLCICPDWTKKSMQMCFLKEHENSEPLKTLCIQKNAHVYVIYL